MKEKVIHYAQSDMTACERELVTFTRRPLIQHTTIPENVTCKRCKKVVEDEKLLEKYLREWCN